MNIIMIKKPWNKRISEDLENDRGDLGNEKLIQIKKDEFYCCEKIVTS